MNPHQEFLSLTQAATDWRRTIQRTAGELNRTIRQSQILLERCRRLGVARTGSAACRAPVSAAGTMAWDARIFVEILTSGGVKGSVCNELDKLSQDQLVELLQIIDSKGQK
jgi:hypothetical protein